MRIIYVQAQSITSINFFNIAYPLMNLKVYIIIIVFSFFNKAWSIKEETNYNVNDGLSCNIIYDINQDNNGFVWIATEIGVCRYSSYGFKKYYSSNGLNSNEVTAIFKDRNGTIWFDCFANWPCFWNGNSIVDVKKYFNLNGEIQNVQQLFYDKWTKEVYVIFKTKPNQSCVFNLTTQKPAFIDNINIYLLAFYNHLNKKYAIINNFKYVLENNQFTMDSSTSVSINPYPSISDIQNQFAEFNVNNQNYIDFKQIVNGEIVLLDKIENRLLIDRIIHSEKNIYGIANNLIYILKNRQWVLLHKSSFKIRNLFIDRNGNMWLSTFKNGIVLIKNNNPTLLFNYQQGFLEKLQYFNNQLFVASNTVTFAVDSTQQVVLNNSYNKIMMNVFNQLYMSNGNEIRILNQQNKEQVIKQTTINGIKYFYPIDQQRIILGNHESFFIYNYIQAKTESQLWAKRCKKIVKVNDSIYILVSVSEFAVLNISKRKVIQTHIVGTINDVVVLDKKVFVSVNNSEIRLFDIDNNKIQQYNLEKKVGFKNVIINKLKVFDNRLYMATNNGWFEFEFVPKTSDILLSNQSIIGHLPSSNNIYDIEVEKEWIYYLDENSLFKINRNLKIDYQVDAFAWVSSKLVQPIIGNKLIEFKRNDNNINIEIDFTSQNMLYKQPFEYKLVGLSDEWILSHNNKLSFPGLNAGKYELFVKVKLPFKNSKIVKLSTFYIQPYFYETLVFKIVSIILLIGTIFLLINYFYNKRRKAILSKVKIARKISDLELQSLRAKMNPHFIFNSLNSIQYYYVINDIKNANYYLIKLTSLIRKILDSSFESKIKIDEEIELINDYLELEKMRLKGRLNHEIVVDESLLNSNIYMPQMLIQPYIENAIKHGLSEKGNIKIHLFEDKGILNVVIEDDGIGIKLSLERKLDNKHISYGSKITSNRLELLKAYYKSDYSIAVIDKSDISNETGTKIIIKLPIDK